MGTKKARWTDSAGKRPYTVGVEEFEPGGNLYVRLWIKQEQRFRFRSLGHKDRARAMEYAAELSTRLKEGSEAVLTRQLTLGRLCRLYRQHRTPQKAPCSQLDDDRCIEMFLRFLGHSKKPEAINLGEWEKFIHQRRTGAIDSRGNPVPPEKRRPVGERSVEGNLRFLKAVIAWGMKWRTPEGQYLLKEDPLRGFPLPKERNPKRPIVTQDRFEKLRAVAGNVMMERVGTGKRYWEPTYLPELLDIVNGTGRRISAICQLRYEDLRLGEGPYGAIRWPADTDKMGYESTVPIGPEVRAAVDRVLRDRPGIGKAYLFPSTKIPSAPLRYELASTWLLQAEKLAGLEKQDGALWHAYRRKWATERKHLPDVDVAAAGGWSTPRTLVEVYQQPDSESMLRVVLEAGQLREQQR